MEAGPTSFTIMVVDDDEIVRDLVIEVLGRVGHRVVAASNGEDALTMAGATPPDLILVDYHMPGMSGLEFVHRLKADAALSRIPVVALTAAVSKDANELSRAGCVAFIPKPFDPTDFQQVIAGVLSQTVGRRRRGRP